MNNSLEPTRQVPRVRIKICGLTRSEDVRAACDYGADAIGFVFYPKSKRCLTPQQAAELNRHRQVFVSSVALFVEPEDRLVRSVLDSVKPTYLQFHGDETPEQCRRFDWPYIKAFRVGAPGLDTANGLLEKCLQYSDASAWLFDSYTEAYGGSGHGFDRTLLSEVLRQTKVPVILSGGLQVDTVADLVDSLKPVAVDVSSGVEIEPGIKSPDKIRAFIEALS